MSKNKWIIILLALLLIVPMLACEEVGGCSGSTTSVVTSKRFVKAHTEVIPKVDPDGDVSMDIRFIPNKWYLTIQTCCKEEGWCRDNERSVSESTYNSYQVGDKY